ncbi:hypothetical protein OCGS_2373 [Oceaniovalibus guishaninsula JLT2003]|uniref:DUF7742 domain-containing protein n=1 Tax=Oceaniovalibus guishaninsula JLT2003 TaxID=1231392 RepID=K2GLT3_9RHOB|nr:hypothetical protein [Oceaniovalibus guishaninsula]EKE43641.1 hypothetical protein OCGS_2373 [Oceaniovalibus guishaninsula JLT2003]
MNARAPRMGDLIALARACLAQPAHRRAWVARRILAEAARAGTWRRATGRVHPLWGDGSVAAAALRRRCAAEPPLEDAEWRACLTLGLDAFAGGVGQRDSRLYCRDTPPTGAFP